MKMLRTLVKRALPSVWRLLSTAKRSLQNQRSPQAVFQNIYRRNEWGDSESVSGPGSNMEKSATARQVLPEFLRQVKAKRFLDIPCGDFYWMKTVDLGQVAYIGGDIVPELIAANQTHYGNEHRTFCILDVVRDKLPQADVILCRDCFIHLPNHMVHNALANIKQSGARYLITTTFVEVKDNIDIGLGGWRPINLELPPFNLPRPDAVHQEGGDRGKSLGVWAVSRL